MQAGITSGYQEKPCLNPFDPDCPATAPNKESRQVRKKKTTKNALLLFSKQLWGRLQAEWSAQSSSRNPLFLALLIGKDNLRHGNLCLCFISAGGRRRHKLSFILACLRNMRCCLEDNFYARDTEEARALINSRLFFFVTQKPDIGSELTGGCYGFATRYNHWPEGLVVGGTTKNKTGHIQR